MLTSEEKKNFKELFYKYCKQEIKKGHCKSGGCVSCPVNKAYEEIFYTFNDEDEED